MPPWSMAATAQREEELDPHGHVLGSSFDIKDCRYVSKEWKKMYEAIKLGVSVAQTYTSVDSASVAATTFALRCYLCPLPLPPLLFHPL